MLLCLYRMRMITEYTWSWWKSSIGLLDSTFAHHKSTLEALAILYESCSVSHVRTLAHTASTADGSESSLQHQHGCASFAWVHLIRWKSFKCAATSCFKGGWQYVLCPRDLWTRCSVLKNVPITRSFSSLVKVKWFPGSDSLKVYCFLDSGQL